MRVFEFVVYDPPTPMGRKRFSARNASGKTFYAEKKDIRSIYHIRHAFKEHYPEIDPIPITIPVKLNVRMWHKAPTVMSKKKRLRAYMKPCVVTKPDINNVINQVCDALSGYAYVDDRQIVWVGDCFMYYAINQYGEDSPPRMTIRVEELEAL